MNGKVIKIILATVIILLITAFALYEIALPFQIQKVNRLIKGDAHEELERYVKRNQHVVKCWPIAYALLTTVADSTPLLSPLETACRENDEKAVDILLMYGSDPNFVPFFQSSNYTPLSIAAARGNIKIVGSLLEHGANAPAQGTGAIIAYLRYRMNCRQEGNAPPVKQFYKFVGLLEERDYTLLTQSSIGYTPMEYAALYGDIKIMQILLLDYGLNANAQAYDGKTILHLYITSGWQEATAEDVLVILTLGTDPEIRDTENKTAYDYAIENGYKEIAQLLQTQR